MFQIIGQPIDFVAFFSVGGDATAALPVTIDIIRINGDGTVTAIVTNVDAADGGNGIYFYKLANPSVVGTYVAKFRDGTETTDQRNVSVTWYVGIAWLQLVYSRTALIGATAGDAVPQLAQYGDTLKAETDVRYEKTITLPGYSLAGWQAIAFTVKERITQDDDGEALLTVRVTNPANAGTDGIIVHNRAELPATNALRGRATITVNDLGPDAVLTITLNAEALDLPASPDTQPYTYEIDVWKDDDKDAKGKGAFVLSQSVRRSTTIP